MSLILLIDRIANKIKRDWRNNVFLKKTGYKANLIGDITLINTNVSLGKNVSIYPNVMFFGDGLIEIGDNVDIGNGVMIYSSKNGGGVKIGKNTMIAAYSYIIDCDHGIKLGTSMRDQKDTVAPIIIGEDVWIAANCTILKGSQIGDGAVIGAKSLVKGEIEENSISVGIPAKVKKYRK